MDAWNVRLATMSNWTRGWYCRPGCAPRVAKPVLSNSSLPVIPPAYWVRTARDWLAEARAAEGISIDTVVYTGPVTVGMGFGLAVRLHMRLLSMMPVRPMR